MIYRWRFSAAAVVLMIAICFLIWNIGRRNALLQSERLGNARLLGATWRDAEHNGANALYLLLKTHGLSMSYEDFLQCAQGPALPQSLTELLAMSRELSQPIEARAITPDELGSMSLPVLTHLEGASPEDGAFVVVLQMQQRAIIVFHGASASIVAMDKESFFRRWSGVVAFTLKGSDRLAFVTVSVLSGFTMATLPRLGLLLAWRRLRESS